MSEKNNAAVCGPDVHPARFSRCLYRLAAEMRATGAPLFMIRADAGRASGRRAVMLPDALPYVPRESDYCSLVV